MNSRRVSILIASRNAREDLKKCLNSIYDNYKEDDVEVIVSDNNSTDGTIDMLTEFFPAVRICRSEEPGSFASAINRGISASTGKFILCLDSDAVIQEKTIPELVNFLCAHPEAGVAVSKMYYPDGTVQLMARKFPGPLNSFFGRESLLTRVFPQNRISKRYLMVDELSSSEPFEADWVSAACMMIKRDVLDEAGFVDEGYPLYWADADWCRRIKDCGWKIYCVPDSRVIHDMRNNPDKKKSFFIIKAFHLGAYRYFRKFHVRSNLNPLNLIAITGLSGRAALHLLLNLFKSEDQGEQ
jgi:GT2 family glycosyltransferase